MNANKHKQALRQLVERFIGSEHGDIFKEKLVNEILRVNERFNAAREEMGGLDIYREGAAIIYAVPYDQVTKAQRHNFKERAFPIIYAPSTRGLPPEKLRELLRQLAEAMREERARHGD